MESCTHPGTSREANEASRPHYLQQAVCVRRTKIKTRNEIYPAAPKTHPPQNLIYSSGTPLWTFNAAATPKGNISDMPSAQPTEQPRTSPPGSRRSEHMPRHPYCGRLPECSVSRAMATGALEAWKKLKLESSRVRPAGAVSYFTDQLTP